MCYHCWLLLSTDTGTSDCGLYYVCQLPAHAGHNIVESEIWYSGSTQG